MSSQFTSALNQVPQVQQQSFSTVPILNSAAKGNNIQTVLQSPMVPQAFTNNTSSVERDNLYETVGMLLQNPQQTIPYISSFNAANPHQDYVINNPLLNQYRTKLEMENSLLNEKERAVEGLVQCPSCRSMKTRITYVQTRSADEGMTEKGRCTACGVGF